MAPHWDVMKPVHTLLALCLAASVFAPAYAQPIEEVVVTGDPVRLLQVGRNDAAFGLDKPLLETPRAVTLVSDTTIARYGVDGLDSLTDSMSS